MSIKKIEIKDYNGKTIYESGKIEEIFFYTAIKEQDEYLDHNEILQRVMVALKMYYKDTNPTPLGELADFVYENYETLNNLESIYDMLYLFYQSIA